MVATVLGRLGRDTLGLLEVLYRLVTMSVNLKVLDMLVDAQDVAGGGQPVALLTAGVAAIERANISRRTKQGLERAWGGGQAGRAALGMRYVLDVPAGFMVWPPEPERTSPAYQGRGRPANPSW